MSETDARIASWQPESYAEMGAAIPFTSPELTGARARCRAGKLEFTLPNPAGKRGVYIMDPGELGRYCAATLHDRFLAKALNGLPAITPASVRRAALGVAAAGYAGRAAAAAAAHAADTGKRAELAMQLAIVRLLVRQIAGDDAAAQTMPAKTAIEAVAARTRRSFTEVRGAIETIAALAAPGGLQGTAEASHPALAARLSLLAATLEGLQGLDNGRAGRSAALVAAVSQDVVALAARALARLWKALDDLPGTIAACLRDQEAVAAVYERLDWVLDGWRPICLVLEQARPGWRCAAVNEMALMVPAVPVEAGVWFKVPTGDAGRQALRAGALGFSDWRRDYLAADLTARNEVFRALAA